MRESNPHNVRCKCILIINFLLISGILLAQNQQIEDVNQLIKEGNANLEQSNLPEAAQRFYKAAYIFWQEGNLENAAQYYSRSLDINKRLGNQKAIQSISSNLGIIYADLGNHEASIGAFMQSLEIARLKEDKFGMTSDMLNIASVYNETKRYGESVRYAETALKLAQEIDNVQLMKRAYGLLAENHKGLGNTDKSMEYFDLFASLEKHMQEEKMEKKEQETKEQIEEMQTITKKAIDEKAEKEKELEVKADSLKIMEALSRERQMQIELLNKQKQLDQMRLKEKEARLKNIALTTYSIVVLAILLGVIAFILYRGNRQKKIANKLLEKQNKEIMRQKEEIHEKNIRLSNNINYAKRIQNAILPRPDSLSQFVPDSFIFYRPRDVVSGDFYWFSDTNLKSVITGSSNPAVANNVAGIKPELNEFIVSAIDCTGHSVPGALMSMVGYNLLHEIISTGYIQPNLILNALHKGILNELKQDESEIQDGMDIALCVVDKQKKKLSFAGAKNPLIYIQNNEIFRIKGDNMSIGGHVSFEENRKFTNHEVSFGTPTTFYIFSDGFIDQLGGEEGRKYLLTNFKNLLLNIHHLPMKEQAAILEKKHLEWRNGYSQIDDILVVGFYLS